MEGGGEDGGSSSDEGDIHALSEFMAAGSDVDSDEEEAEERWTSLLSQDAADPPVGQSPRAFKQQRVQALLSNMLALEQPVITGNMIDFLLQDGVSEQLVAFITQPKGEKQLRDGDGVLLEYADRRVGAGGGAGAAPEPPPALVTSHRAVMLLASEDPTDALLTFLGQCAATILSALFDCFDACAAGNFFHACAVIERLAEQHTDAVYGAIAASPEATEAHLGRILQYVEFAPVGETATNLICPPPATFNAKHWNQRVYVASTEARFAYYRALSQFRLLSVIVKHVVAREHTDAHALAAADLLRELLRRLSINDHGELLLAPLGHCAEVLEGVLQCAVATDDPDVTPARRTACMDVLLAILQSCMEKEIAGPAVGPYETFGGTTTTMVPNCLANFAPEILDIFHPWFDTFCSIIASEHRLWARQRQQVADGAELTTMVRHGSFAVPAPFSHFRVCVIAAVVALVQANADLLKKISTEVWRSLVSWFVELPHCNLFHNLFFKLLMAVLRANNTSSLKALLQEQKLVSLLNDAYADTKNKSNIGHIIKCSNAIRLQASTLPPTAFLRIFLRSHDTWQRFLPVLCERTKADQVPGLGLPVPSMGAPSMSWNSFGSSSIEPETADCASQDIDVGSAYARNLGFEHDVPWPDTDESLAHAGAKQSKKDKRGKKKAERSSRVSRERELCQGMAADAAIAMEERCGRVREGDESKGRDNSAEDDVAAAAGGGASAAAVSSPAAAPEPPQS